MLKNDLLDPRTGCMQFTERYHFRGKSGEASYATSLTALWMLLSLGRREEGEKMKRTEAQNTPPHCLARPKNALETTHIHLSAPTSSARNTSFGALRDSSTPAPRRSVTRNPTASLSIYLLLMRSAHGRETSDAKIESENLHRHARAALFRPSRQRRMWK